MIRTPASGWVTTMSSGGEYGSGVLCDGWFPLELDRRRAIGIPLLGAVLRRCIGRSLGGRDVGGLDRGQLTQALAQNGCPVRVRHVGIEPAGELRILDPGMHRVDRNARRLGRLTKILGGEVATPPPRRGPVGLEL